VTPACFVDVKTLFIVNDQPYGSERPYNALRLADALARRDGPDAGQLVEGGATLDARGARRLDGLGRQGGHVLMRAVNVGDSRVRTRPDPRS
jgi:uncharacterized protein involved in oxidation of intracellular sulfur